MKRLLKYLIILGILAGGGYVGFWFYGASQIESEIKTLLSDATQQTADSETRILYSNLKVTGFPLEYKIEIHGLSFDAKDKKNDVMVGVSFDDPIKIAHNVAHTAMDIEFPKKGVIRHTAGSDFSSTYSYIANSAPKLHVELSENMESVMNRVSGKQIKPEDIRLITYKDNGSKVLDNESGQLVYANAKSDIIIEMGMDAAGKRPTTSIKMVFDKVETTNPVVFDETEIQNILQTLKIEDEQGLRTFLKESPLALELIAFTESLGPMYYVFDVDITGTLPKKGQKRVDDLDIKINQIAFANDKYAMNSDAEIKVPLGKVGPSGWYRLNLTEAKQQLRHLYLAINYVLGIAEFIPDMKKEVDQAQVPLKIEPVNEDQLKQVTEFLYWIAGEEDLNKPHIEIVAYSDKDGQLVIGKRQMGEIMMQVFSMVAPPSADGGPGIQFQMEPAQ